MKHGVVVALLSLLAASSYAQSKQLIIRQGNTLEYMVHTPNGDVPVIAVLSNVSEDLVRFDWQMHQMAGTFRVEKASLDSARQGYWHPPVDGEDVILDPSQSLLQLSKACWRDIQLNKPMVFGSTRYHVIKKFDRYEAGGVAIDCLYLESVDKQSGLWIANNEKLPMILKIDGNPDGVNVELVAVR
jgi:hypothetical protein